MNENIEKIFISEIIEKKHTVNSNRHRSGNSVRKSARKVFFVSDSMSRKEKRQHTKAGKVECYNMYETILPKDEFFLKDLETQKLMMSKWRDMYSNEKVMKGMGITANATFARIINELNLPKKRRVNTNGRKTKSSVAITTKVGQVKEVKQEVIEQEDNVVKLITNGLHLEYNGVYDADSINRILTKLQLLVDGEENKFRINIEFSEVSA